MNEQPKYEVFISYRRDGGVDYARMIYLELKGRGYNTFFDFNSLRSGKFNEGIFKAIDECRYFILVLSENALTRCMNEDDWVRHEIEYALSKGKEIIPVCPSGSTRGFPAEMPASFEPLRNIQVSRLDMDDLFDKSFDKIVEDRFEEEFRKGRSPAGSVSGVTNKSFNKIGLCIVGAILVAAAVVTLAIVNLGGSNDQKNEEPTGPISVKRGTKEESLFNEAMHKQTEGRRMMSKLKENGWSPAETEFVKASALLEQSEGDFRRRKFKNAVDKASEMLGVLTPLVDKLAEKKLLGIDAELVELELTGDQKLRKKLELIKEIYPISLTNKKVCAAKAELEDLLYPRMRVTAVCNGNTVPAKFSLEIPLRREDKCSFCENGRSFAEGSYCGACKNNPRWLEVCHDYTPGISYMNGQLFMPGTKFNSEKDGAVYAQKNDVIGVIRIDYCVNDEVYSGRSDKIIANWVGETNVIVILNAPQRHKPGEVRIVPLPRCEEMEFVWCPPGDVLFEYQQPGSGAMKQGQISVKRGFWIAKYETSCRQSLGYCDSQNERFSATPHLFWWKYACQYAKKIQTLIGGTAEVRIPTAAEWEIAAHYGDFHVTESTIGDYAWVDEPGVPRKGSSDKSFLEWKYHEQGGKKENPLGLYDMYGNAEEWTTGTIDQDLGLKSPGVPKCDICGKGMCVRGGSIRTSVSNAVKILTRDYFKGRAPCLDWKYYAKDQVEHSHDKWPHNAAVRLVADNLPSNEEMVKRFGGRHWLCEECGMFETSMKEPAGTGCKKGKHKWNWLEDVGEQKFKCKNCGKELMTRGYPRDVYSRICPGPAGQQKKKDFMGREETYMHKWEKVK